ncbi:HNH endonuclease family protein [Cellulomonas fengjieae]|uniref:HNH endonuclease family protein n=1 Tax=Cellulomonas fengjieae TaxID=2819978 RepID=UPI003557DCB9
MRSPLSACLAVTVAVSALLAGCQEQGVTDVRPMPTPAAEQAVTVPDAVTTMPESVTPQPVTPAPVTPPVTPEPATPSTALATVALLPVKGRAPKTGYDRDLYGHAWKDVDRNGCDTRNDILRRDLVDQVIKDGTHGCVVAAGTLHDPYSGEPIAFVRGQGTSSAVQIDHVVALSDSWQKGAQQWDTATREAFANDPLNLLAADGPLNQRKGDGDTATWLPPNTGFRCAYVARQVGVKHAYGLWVTQAEQDAMVRVLSTCPSEPLPVG